MKELDNETKNGTIGKWNNFKTLVYAVNFTVSFRFSFSYLHSTCASFKYQQLFTTKKYCLILIQLELDLFLYSSECCLNDSQQKNLGFKWFHASVYYTNDCHNLGLFVSLEKISRIPWVYVIHLRRPSCYLRSHTFKYRLQSSFSFFIIKLNFDNC